MLMLVPIAKELYLPKGFSVQYTMLSDSWSALLLLVPFKGLALAFPRRQVPVAELSW